MTQRPRIDVHAHAAVPAAMRLTEGHVGAEEARRRDEAAQGEASALINREQIASVMPLLLDLDLRLAAMDRMRVDIQLVSPTPVHYHDWAEPELAERFTRATNEGIASSAPAGRTGSRGSASCRCTCPTWRCASSRAR